MADPDSEDFDKAIGAACHNLGILKTELKYKTFEEFALPNLPENIQTLRFNQAESGRQLLWGKVKEEVARIQHEAELYPESGVVTRRTRRKTGSNENQVKIQKIRKTARENARALQDDWTGKFERNIEALMMHHDDEMNTLALSAVHREQAKTKLRTREIRRAAKLVEKEKALQEQAKTRKAYRHKTYERVMKKEAKDRKKFRDIVKRKEIRTEKQMKTLKKEWESKHFVGYRSRQAVEDNSAELEAELVRKEQAAAIRVRQEKEKKERLNLMRIRQSRERNETAQERQFEEQAKLKKKKEEKWNRYQSKMARQKAAAKKIKDAKNAEIADKKKKDEKRFAAWRRKVAEIEAKDAARTAVIEERATRLSKSVGRSVEDRNEHLLYVHEIERLKQERVKQNLARLERARANRVIAWEDKIDEDMERVQAFEQAKASIQQTKAEHDYITFVQNERFRKDFAKMRDGATLDDVIQAAVKAEQTHIDTFEAEEEGLEDTIAI